MTESAPSSGKRFGQIAGNRNIDAMIYRCFEHINDADAAAFVRLFRAQIDDSQQVMHTFRELVLGGFLGSRRQRMRYNVSLENQTPDWCRLSPAAEPDAIVEVVNFHPPRILERDIDTVARTGVWVGRMPPHVPRLRSRLEDKAAAYRTLVERRGIPYVIGVFSEFTADVEPEELRECLFHSEHGLFDAYPAVSGIIFFEERSGVYRFQYTANPKASRPLLLPEGEF